MRFRASAGGYQVWLEWTCLSERDGRVIDSACIELPLERRQGARPRLCRQRRAEPEEPCRVQARVLVTPLDGGETRQDISRWRTGR